MTIAPRVWFWAAIVRPLKHVVPLPLLIQWIRPSRRDAALRPDVEPALSAYLNQRGRFPARPPGNCLDRSLAAYRVLCAIGADPRLVVGVRPRAGGIDGHVWLMVDGQPFAERGDIETFASIVTFDAEGRREPGVGRSPDLTGIRWA